MTHLLFDLYGHQAWADAEHWRALEAHPSALTDPALWKRLYHIHIVQRAFMRIVTGEPLVFEKHDTFTAASLKAFARASNEQAAAWLQVASQDDLQRRLVIPWFKDPPIEITVGEALTQAAMHSHYHRGQNATRLRELGGVPPLTDLIVWYWKGRPAATWE
jgi:uncharacterized damage-inducible protein DinB